MAHRFLRFHRLFRTPAVTGGSSTLRAALATVVLAASCGAPVAGQRSWGDAAFLVQGPAAAAADVSSASVTPFNPAVNARGGMGAELSLAVPMGLRELAVHRAAGRIPVRGTVASLLLGRLGFDRLAQHRLAVGIARRTSPDSADAQPDLSIGIRATFDHFSSVDGEVAIEHAVSAGVLLKPTVTSRIGLVAVMREADVHGARSMDVTGAAGFDAGRHLQTSVGWTHRTGQRSEMAASVRLDSRRGVSLTTSLGGGPSGPGVALLIRSGGVRIGMAWLRTGPAGATRYVSAALLKHGLANE